MPPQEHGPTGSLAACCHSVDDLKKAIRSYINAYNQDPKPFVWTAKASYILEKVMRARKTLDKVAQTA